MGGHIVSGPQVGQWIAEKISGTYLPGSVAIGLERNGVIEAGVMFESWNKRSIVAHMAVAGRLTRSFIGEIFRYAYNTAAVHKVILPVSSANGKSISFVEHLGFREEARIRDADPSGDIIIYTLAKPDCRFLGERYG
jgi:hypothetical protein